MTMSCCGGGAPTDARETAKHEHDPKEGKQGGDDCCGGGGGGGKHAPWMTIVVWILVGAVVIFFVRTVVRDERSIGATALRTTQPSVAARAAAPSATIGNVTVVVSSVNRSASETTVALVLDTHSVELDAYDIIGQMRLRGRDGAENAGVISGGSGSSHHKTVTLTFAGATDAAALIVRNLDGVPETVIPLN